MKAVSVNIDSIHIDPANLRMHPARNLDTIKASLARFGQQKPIVVDGNGICRAGNGTLEAARALGWEKIEVVKTPLAGSEAIAYAIADNRTAELALWDDDRLGETLKALQLEDFNLDDIGFSQDEFDQLIGDIVDDPQGEWQGMPEFESEDEMPFRTLRVHFRNAEDLNQFGAAINQAIPEKADYLWFPPRPQTKPSSVPYVSEA